MTSAVNKSLLPVAKVRFHEEQSRDRRQTAVLKWASNTFGGVANDAGEVVDACSPEQRALRFLEEAIELCQAVLDESGAKHEEIVHFGVQAHNLVTRIFSLPPGTVFQETGGVMVTLLAMAEVMGISVAKAEEAEFQRVLSKPDDWFRARQRDKLNAGF